MSGVRLTAHLAAPVVMTDEIHLDGLFASAHPLGRHTNVGRETPVSDLIHIPTGIFCLTAGAHTVAICTTAHVAPDSVMGTSHAVRRRDGEDIEALARPINLGLGPGKNRVRPLPIVATPTLTWWCLGDRRNVLRLARRISHIGSERASGYGVVARWEAEYEADYDAVRMLFDDGVTQRHLPLSWCVGALRHDAAPIQPPYWHPGRRVPEVVRAGTPIAGIHDRIAEEVRHAADPAVRSEHRQRHNARRDARRARAESVSAAES